MIRPWKKIKTTPLNENPHGGYYQDIFETAEGKRGEYFYHSNPNAVSVFAEREDGRFVMIREFRYLIGRVSISQVQGGIEPGETPEESARRELKEEIGCTAKSLVHIGKFATAPAFSTEEVDVYLARGLECEKNSPDAFENIEVITMSAEEIDAAIASGEIWDGQAIAPWQMLKSYLTRQK